MVFTRSKLRARSAEIAEKAKLFAERAKIRRESELDVAVAVAIAAEPEMERYSVMTQHSNDGNDSNDTEEEIMEETVWKEEEDGAVVSGDDLRAVAVNDWIVLCVLVAVLAAAATVVVCAPSIHVGFGVGSNLMMASQPMADAAVTIVMDTWARFVAILQAAWQPVTDVVTIVMDCWTRLFTIIQTAWIASKWGLWAAWSASKWGVLAAWSASNWGLWAVWIALWAAWSASKWGLWAAWVASNWGLWAAWIASTWALWAAWIASKWCLWAAWVACKWVVWSLVHWILLPVFKSYPLEGLYVMVASALVYIFWRKIVPPATAIALQQAFTGFFRGCKNFLSTAFLGDKIAALESCLREYKALEKHAVEMMDGPEIIRVGLKYAKKEKYLEFFNFIRLCSISCSEEIQKWKAMVVEDRCMFLLHCFIVLGAMTVYVSAVLGLWCLPYFWMFGVGFLGKYSLHQYLNPVGFVEDLERKSDRLFNHMLEPMHLHTVTRGPQNAPTVQFQAARSFLYGADEPVVGALKRFHDTIETKRRKQALLCYGLMWAPVILMFCHISIF